MTRFILIIAISIFTLNVSAQDSNNIQRDFTIKLLEEKVSNLQQQIEKSEAHLKELQDAKKEEIEKVMNEKEASLNTRMIIYSGFFIALLSLGAWLLNWLGKKEIRNIVAEFTKTKVDEELSVKLSKEVIDTKLTEWGEPAIRKMVEELTEAGHRAKQHEEELAVVKQDFFVLKDEMEKLKASTYPSKERHKERELNEVIQEVKKEENFTADDWFWKGVEAKNAENYEAAIGYLTKALDLSSTSEYYTFRAYCYNMISEYEKSISDSTKALGINPQNDVALHNRGISNTELKKYVEAIRDLDEAIKIDAQSDTTWHARGDAKNSLGRYEEAISDYDEGLRINPKSSFLWNNRGAAKNGLGRYEEAISDLNEAIKLEPTLSNPYKHRSYSYYKLGNLRLGLDDINIAIKLKPEYKEAVELKEKIQNAINNSTK